MTAGREPAGRSLPHESDHERGARLRLARLLASSPIPPGELSDNLALYLRRQPLTDLLSLGALYRMILDVPGVIIEFGVHRGRHLAALTALRGVHEPYNPHRRIIGFDTFTARRAGASTPTRTTSTCATSGAPCSSRATSATRPPATWNRTRRPSSRWRTSTPTSTSRPATRSAPSCPT